MGEADPKLFGKLVITIVFEPEHLLVQRRDGSLCSLSVSSVPLDFLPQRRKRFRRCAEICRHPAKSRFSLRDVIDQGFKPVGRQRAGEQAEKVLKFSADLADAIGGSIGVFLYPFGVFDNLFSPLFRRFEYFLHALGKARGIDADF